MNSLESLVDSLNLEPWPTAGVILGVTLIAAQIAAMVVSRFLARLAARTRTDLDDRTIRILSKPIFMTVLLIGLALAEVQLGLPPRVERITLSLLQTVGILVWMAAAFRLTSLYLDPVRAHGESRFISNRTAPLFNNLIKIATVVGGVYLLITAWHIDATAWLASAGIAGIALGFAAKDTLANLFAGVFILADAPYKVGDYINFETGERGEVTHIGLRSTRILTRDDIEITIPNSLIGNSRIVNETGGRWSRRRIQIRVGVAYGSDVDRVREVLMEAGRDTDLICSDPAPLVRFRAFGESSLDFDLLVWIEEPVLRGRAIDALNDAIYKHFAREGITIPFPQRDLWVKKLPPQAP